MIYYIFDCTKDHGHMARIPTRFAARIVAWCATRITGRFHDYHISQMGV